MSKTGISQLRIPLPGGPTYDETNFWHRDWLGSVRLVSSRTGRSETIDRAFAPYGETYNAFGATNDVNFTGDNQDLVVGTFDTPNRELNPTQGRWISPDPAHSGVNGYSYTTNPLGEIDPSGLYPCIYCGHISVFDAVGAEGFGDTYYVNGMEVSAGTLMGILNLGNGPAGAEFWSLNYGSGNGINTQSMSYNYQYVQGTTSDVYDQDDFTIVQNIGGWQLIGETLSGGDSSGGGVLMAANNGWITAATDAASVVGLFTKGKVAKVLGAANAAVSFDNDPKATNLLINVLGSFELFEATMAIDGAFVDFLDWGVNNSSPGPQKVYNQDQLGPTLPQQDGGCQAAGMGPC